MAKETMNVIIDDDLFMDVNSGVIGSKEATSTVTTGLPIEELLEEIDVVESAINDIESSLNSKTLSSLSMPNREGIYYNAGFLTNVVLGVILALVLLILLV